MQRSISTAPSRISCAASSPSHRQSTAAQDEDEQRRHQPLLPRVVLLGNQRKQLRRPGATQHAAARATPVLVAPPLQNHRRSEQHLYWSPPDKFRPSRSPSPPAGETSKRVALLFLTMVSRAFERQQRKAPGAFRTSVCMAVSSSFCVEAPRDKVISIVFLVSW